MTITAIANLLITKEDADGFCQFLDQMRDGLTRNNQTFGQAVKALSSSDWQLALLEACKSNNVDIDSKIQINEFLPKLKQTVREMPVIELKVAVDPKNLREGSLPDLIRQSVGKNVLISFQKDESLVAGAIVAYNGYLKDYSLKNQLNQIHE